MYRLTWNVPLKENPDSHILPEFHPMEWKLSSIVSNGFSACQSMDLNVKIFGSHKLYCKYLTIVLRSTLIHFSGRTHTPKLHMCLKKGKNNLLYRKLCFRSVVVISSWALNLAQKESTRNPISWYRKTSCQSAHLKSDALLQTLQTEGREPKDYKL